MKNGKSSQKEKLFYLSRMRWIYLIGAIIIIGGVMSFGLIASFFLDFDEEKALSMIWMIPPMLLIYILSVRLLLAGLQKRMGRLMDGIHAVAGGELTVQLDQAGAEEYTQIYREFNAMVRELSRTKEEMQGFTNTFAHEFKTPITSIKGFADLLMETGGEIETPERMEYLEAIAGQSDRLCRLSQNVLLLSKMEATQVVTGKEEYDLAEQIRSCAILLYKDMEKKEIRLSLPEDWELSYCGNREMLEHVWINLLHNAVKFTPEGGRITIDGEKKDGIVCVRVSDTGSGMDPETLAHMYDKYYQNDPSSLAKGNGIGLSIVKRIITLCEGEISCESSPGEGSTFTVRLPV